MKPIEKAKHWLIHKLGGYTYIDRFEQKVVAVQTSIVKLVAEQEFCESDEEIRQEIAIMAKNRLTEQLASVMKESGLILFDTNDDGQITHIRATMKVVKEGT